MDTPAPDPVAQVLGRLLRHPEPPRDIELERALARLQAARSDAAYLLLHRVMVLECALQQVRQGTEAASAASLPPQPATTRSFLRDAAVVTAGVVAGQALWQGIGGDAMTEGLDLEGWI